MTEIEALTLSVLGLVGGLLTLGLIARLWGALFLESSYRQVRKYPIWHIVWFFLVVIFVGASIEIPKISRKRWIKFQLLEIRQKVQVAINDPHNRNELRAEVQAISNQAKTNTLALEWHFDRGTNLTNSLPLLTKLNPYRVLFEENAMNSGYAVVQIFYTQSGGGRANTRYYDLVMTPTNNDEPPVSFLDGGDKLRKLTNSVYEITWNF